MSNDIREIWEKYSNPLLKYILKHINNRQDAEDLLQEVFIKVHKNLKGVQNESIKPWLYKITKNTIIDYYRKSQKVKYSELTEEISIESDDDNGASEEVVACLSSMINDLPDKYKKAIILTDLGSMSQKQYAEREKISKSGAKSRVQRARKKLKDMLTDCCTYQFDRLGNIIDYEKKQKDCKYC